MSGVVNWKQKYMELKSKFMESVETAFRLGFEQGAQQAQQDQVAQQAQQQAELQQAQAQGMGGGMDGGFGEQEPQLDDGSNGAGATMPAGPGKGIEPDPNAPGAQNPGMIDSANPAGSELDQHIQKLEGMLGKSEGLDVDMLKSTISDLKNLQKTLQFQVEMKKSASAIPAIAKAIHKPKFKLGVQANHNMNQNAKTAVTMQHKIVEGVMEKWEAEEKKASSDILSQLNLEGLTKNE